MGTSYPLGPSAGRLLVKTARTGLGAKAGHDLTLEARAWHGTAVVDTSDPAGCSVAVSVEAGSLQVREGTGGVKPLSASDRAEIEKTFRTKVLHTAEHPEIAFRSRQVAGTPEAFTVEGDLTIMGVTQPLTIQGKLADGRAQGSATVTQSRWGIRPYSAFFGALKLKDDVQVEFDVTLAAGG
jgi:polyisoprenoid-binding protein YceI